VATLTTNMYACLLSLIDVIAFSGGSVGYTIVFSHF
jgi:hypothetical protein